MVIKSYSVTLDEELVEGAKKIMSPEGKKLSPVLNNLLREWLAKENKIGVINNGISE
jgi:hypothetical protein